ncbi:hypothetical protein NQZ68_020290 [Dissostichus eleginoides]|nr:hypothetical protein NQZ68_020290 [Dissostichus eleginoides]
MAKVRFCKDCKDQLVRRRLAPVKELMRCLIPVVRLNIRGRSHCTWLRCPIHPAHMESQTPGSHMCYDVVVNILVVVKRFHVPHIYAAF